MSYLEELLPEFKKGAKIRMKDWPKPFYYEMRNRKVYNQDGHRVKNFSHQALFKNVWELYKDPEPDWQCIIDNRCLCEFWDDEEYSIVGYLVRIHEKIEGMHGIFDDYKFMEKNGRAWKNCRPYAEMK